MAKRKSKQLSVVQKILIFAGVLIVVQVVLLFVLGDSKEPVTIREAIDQAVAKNIALDSRRKEQLRIQLAINDFMAENGGNPPQSLDKLVPFYFDSVPIDPDTGNVFSYKIVNNRPLVGAKPKSEGTEKKGTAKSSSGAQAGDDAPLSKGEQEALIASLSEESSDSNFIYDASNKRDPFRPFSLAPKTDEDSSKTPLEKFAIGQLRLTAVLDGLAEPKAIVENSEGRGFTVKKGTKIGTNNGVIVDIKPDKIIILETSIDFTGEKKNKTIEMSLRTADQES